MRQISFDRGITATIGAYCLFSLAAPLTKWLTVHGMDLGLGGGEAISFCNLLFLSNISAAIAISFTSRPKHTVAGWKKLSQRGVVSLVGTAALAIIVPAAFFFALKMTSVANIILISRAGPIFYTVAASFVLHKPITRSQVVGYGFIGAAIAFTILLNSRGQLMLGDILALSAAFGAAMVSLVGRPALREAGNRPFLIGKNLMSAIGFAAIALYIFGPSHFADLLLPNLIVGISVYGVLVVGLAQLLWNDAVLHASPKAVGGLSFISPLGGIIVTTLLLHEPPAGVQVWALVLVAIGMLIAARGRTTPPNPPADASLAAA